MLNVSFLTRKSLHERNIDPIAAARQLLTRGEVVSETDAYRSIEAVVSLYEAKSLKSLVPSLPVLFNLKGEPFTLHDHFPMEPLFDMALPRQTVLKCGRQVTKSTTLAVQNSLQSLLIPDFASLYICPRFEQTRRFSNNYARPIVERSPIRSVALSPRLEHSVLQRSFVNGSVQHFSYAFLDCDRTRGISSDKNIFDECQDIDASFIPIINETMSHSKHRFVMYAGTPKTFDNTLQALFDESSQGEWVTKCEACNYWNIFCVSEDLLHCIQPEGLVCRRCSRPINPRRGSWVHRFEDKLTTFLGLHIPQAILPLHYEDKEHWTELIAAKNKDKVTLFNEKLGESFDVRRGLITKEELRKASSTTRKNDIRAALKLRNRYVAIVIGVDWGGGGKKGISHTALAVVGFLPSGKSDVIYGERLSDAYGDDEEATVIYRYATLFRAILIAHDFGGSGSVREILLTQVGIPLERIFPAYYVRATSANLVTPRAAADGMRAYYSIDKARSLVLLCRLIAAGGISFPEFKSWEHLASDFTALVEDKHAVRSGSDIYLVDTKANQSDDFAHAVNFAHLAYWEHMNSYPAIAEAISTGVNNAIADMLQPDDPNY